MSSWNQDLSQLLQQKFGKAKGASYDKKYRTLFRTVYQDETDPEIALFDIEHIEKLSANHNIEVYFYSLKESANFHLRLLTYEKPLPLSEIVPILQNFGLTTFTGNSYTLTLADGKNCLIDDFLITYEKEIIETDEIELMFQDAFSGVLQGNIENDSLNQLTLLCGLQHQEVALLRAYAKYLKQTNYRFSQIYIEKTLVAHPEIAALLVDYFKSMHDPLRKNNKIEEANIFNALENVSSLDEDSILRRLTELITNTLRTNFFTTHVEGSTFTISLKLNSRGITQLPQPVPLYETFVYSARFEGIHLRNSKVARGGIRWSDRNEDFRTEILGLMKAQTVKNAVIVPSGAKGGFVLKTTFAANERDALMKEGISCYKNFIRSLLSLTDNIIKNKIVPPKNVRCHDDTDTYLVVAADKGTASFSDIANQISLDMSFWLGDAFASGGSAGYDHKKIGITARGAWESIKRSFRELDINIEEQPITVVGIGDMSGDVFGNGMIYSRNIKLIAAFDHRDIFLDPNPDLNKSYDERMRMFKLPRSSWQDYNSKLISEGGGVYSRSLKSISLSPQIKKILQIEEDKLSPNALVRAILKAPVDLLYNGGIGTYVKAANENAADVGDRANDYTRIDGNELKAKVVGEGGNLGFTQLGRTEYALNAGKIYSDFIDNSAGVDCSDHEVNLKILLNTDVQNKKLSVSKRDKLLASYTEEVAALVLNDNYEQALALSFGAYHAKSHIALDSQYIKDLDAQGILKRKIEFLPDDKQLIERKADSLGLTRPELAVLFAYAKISLKNEILKTKIDHDPFLSQIAARAFPHEIAKKFAKLVDEHPLKPEIIATQISNQIVNEMGISFIYRIQIETGARIEDIVKAYTIASHVFETHSLQEKVIALDFKIALHDQYEIIYYLRKLIHISTRWFLRSRYLQGDIEKTIQHFSARIKKLSPLIFTLMTGDTKKYLESYVDKFTRVGLPKKISDQVATFRAIYTTLNIIDVSDKNNIDLMKAAKVYFRCGEAMHLVWFRDQIANDNREGYVNALARLTLRDELDIVQKKLTVAVIRDNGHEKNSQQALNQWMKKNKTAMDRWNKILALLHGAGAIDYTMFFIAMRELLSMIKVNQ